MLAWPALPAAEAADARLENATQQREAVQQRLDEVLARLDAAEAATAQVRDRVEDLRAQAQQHGAVARTANGLLEARVREAYKRGEVPPTFVLLGAGPDDDGVERARLLSVLADRHQTESETATSARIRAAAAAAAVDDALTLLEAREAELADARADVQAALAQAEAHEIDVRAEIAAEAAAAAARAARQRAARQRSATTTTAAAPAPAAPAPAAPAASGGGGGGGGGGAPVSGGIACPIGTPRSYSDTYGAPRSGGRSHMGTDILSPMGTPIYAYESGTVTRLYGSSLGGISLYLQGDSGNVYYYTHLSGYASGMSAGKRVSAGTLVAYNGDSGNAAGIPHLHFEVMPGGGSNVNPYPYVLRACG